MYVVIDCMYLVYRGAYAMKNTQLQFNEIRTEIPFNFLDQIFTIMEDIGSNRLIFCWDSSDLYRKEIYSGYKDKEERQKDPRQKKIGELARTQAPLIRDKILPMMGFRNVFLERGLESDDLIAHIVNKFRGRDESITIVSSDDDLLQLVRDDSPTVVIYNPITKKFKTETSFTEEWRITPKDWARVKAIAGCKSDCVPGVPGVAEATAVKYLLGELKTNSKKYKSIQEHEDIIKRNKGLVELPFKSPPPELLISADEITLPKLMDTFGKYGFRSFLGQVKLNRIQDLLILPNG